MKIKKWKKFQHYKKRRPPWIRLYTELMDDLDWHCIPGDSAKVLVMLWLLASEDPELEGHLPPMKKICFRLRMDENEVMRHLSILSSWLELEENEVLAPCKQSSMPEQSRTESESKQKTVRKTNRIDYPSDFEKLWKLYPGSGSKKQAYAEYKKAEVGADEMAVAIENQIDHKNKLAKAEKFVPEWPHLCRWIKHERWNDKLTVDSMPEKPKAVAIKDDSGKIRYTSMTQDQIQKLIDDGYERGVDNVWFKEYDDGIPFYE